MGKYLILILLLYSLTLFQTSFLIHFDIRGYVFNFVFLSVLLISFLEGQKENFGLFSAFFGGFFLDIFSGNFIGYWILVLLGTSLFVRYIFKRYVRLPLFGKV